jgi:hypothetical protein
MKIKLSFILLALVFSSLAIAAEKRYPVPLGGSPQLGPKDALITIIEFLDFQ